jgi:hypothetical protein
MSRWFPVQTGNEKIEVSDGVVRRDRHINGEPLIWLNARWT